MIARSLLVLCLFSVFAPVDEWAEYATLSRDRDPDKRCQAIDKIKKHKDLRMAQALLPLLADTHPRVRHRAMCAIRCATDEAVPRFLAEKALRNANKYVRQGALAALAGLKEPTADAAIIERLGDSEPEVRTQACETLATLQSTTALDALEALFTKEHDAVVRATALEALVRTNPGRAAETTLKASSDKAYQVRMVAVESASKLTADQAVRVFTPAVKDSDWRVRSAAIQTSRELRKRECITGLIEQFPRESGRLRWEILVALQDLSGRDLGPDPKPWKTWWDAAGETFNPPAKGSDGDGGGSTTAEFFKVPIVSNRILFILDLSGSMRDPAPGKADLTKLNVAKEGMCATIKSLDDGVRFGIIGIGSDEEGAYALKEQKTWRRQLHLWPANAGDKAEADKWVRGVEAKGWTNLWDAIEYGLSDADVDTIFLYTDGGVSRGVWVAAGELLSALHTLNRFRRITINAVEVPGSTPNSPDNVKLLKDIATATGGTYRLAGEKK